MNKVTKFFLTICIITACVLVLNIWKKPDTLNLLDVKLHDTKKTEKGKKHGAPNEARDYDITITKNPRTGRPEPEKLDFVYKLIARHKAYNKSSSASKFEWKERGADTIGGRTRSIMFDPNDKTNKKLWAGGVTGGLWYNNNITDKQSEWIKQNNFTKNLSVSCMTYDPNDTKTFYVGTGECYFTSSGIGEGIWKSTDGGQNWKLLESTKHLRYIQNVIVKNNSGKSILYFIAAYNYYEGLAHSRNYKGLYKSTDGGITIEKISGEMFSDIDIDKNGTIWIAGYNHKIYTLNETTNELVVKHNPKRNIQSSALNRLEIACAPSNENYVYAIFSEQGSVSTMKYTKDAGRNWITLTQPNDEDTGISAGDFSRGQAWYDLILKVRSDNPKEVYAGGINLFKSIDSGKNWKQISRWTTTGYGMQGKPYSYVHADQHNILFSPTSNQTIVVANDGGIFYCKDITNAESSSTAFEARIKKYNVSQFYSCAIYPTKDNSLLAIGGTQDNGSWVMSGFGSGYVIAGGDGGYCFFDQTDPSSFIISFTRNDYILGSISNNITGSKSIRILTDSSTGNFINCADFDSTNNNLYTFKKSNISNAELYRVEINNGKDNPTMLSKKVSTITIEGDFDNEIITNIKVCPYRYNKNTTLFFGNNKGQIYRVTDANTDSYKSTKLYTPFENNGSISCITFGSNENEILVTLSSYGVQSVWFSYDGGKNWLNKENNLPDMPIRWAMFNPINKNNVILATEVGVWGTDNFRGKRPLWSPYNTDMGNVRVNMLKMNTNNNMVLAATYGRGTFISDGFNKLEKSSSKPDTDTNSKKLIVYPNPVKSGEFFNVFMELEEFIKITVTVSTMDGKVVYRKDTTIPNTNVIHVNIPTLTTGKYIVNCSGKGYNKSQILLVKPE